MEEKNNSSMKRTVALKVNVSEILNGDYVKEEGWTPNYVNTQRGQASRVNIIGVVISKADGGNESLMIDDSTGAINVRTFENKELLKNRKIGELVILIGRPREYNGEKYILAEVVRKLEDKTWAAVRRKELANEHVTEVKRTIKQENKKDEEEYVEVPVKKVEPIIAKKEEMTLQPQSNPYEVVLGLIKSIDTGFGVSYEEIIMNAKLKNCEEIIQSLIEEGEIFEIRPGILKVL